MNNTTTVFENALRSGRWRTLDNFRCELRENPHVGDYLAEQFLKRNLVRLQEDGQVVGVSTTREQKQLQGRVNATQEWKSTWPKKAAMLDILKDGPLKFATIQKKLKARGEVTNHWFVIHALWNLEHSNLAVKTSDGYRLEILGETPADEPAPPPSLVDQKFLDDMLVVAARDVGYEDLDLLAKTWVDLCNAKDPVGGYTAGELQDLVKRMTRLRREGKIPQ